MRTELPMGIEVIRNGQSGMMSVLVAAKTFLNQPVREQREYSTSDDNQTTCTIQVFEGTAEKTKDCTKIGDFELSGFPPKPKGEVKIQVTFSINGRGELTVEACDAQTGKVNQMQHKLKNLELPTILRK